MRPLAEPPRPFFFLRRQWLLYGSHSANAFIDLNEGSAQLLPLAERINLALDLTLGRRSRKALGHSPSTNFVSKSCMRGVAGIIGAMAMTTRISASKKRNCQNDHIHVAHPFAAWKPSCQLNSANYVTLKTPASLEVPDVSSDFS